MSAIWFCVAAMMVLESAVTCRIIFRFRKFFLREASGTPESARFPKAAVLAPIKGIDQDLEAHIQCWLSQDYPDFTVFCIVESEEDPAASVLKSVPGLKVLVAGQSIDCGQKIHNLHFAISQLSAEYEILAFVDSDGRVGPDWLKALAAKVMEHPEDAATGYRWFDPKTSFACRLRSAWNASVLTLYEESGKRNFAWGGSMAILRRSFEDVNVPAFWQGSLSDDYALTNAVRKAGRRVHFVPRAMAISTDDITLEGFLSWATRQLLITKLYFPHIWRMALGFHVVWMFWLIAGLAIHPFWFVASFLFVQTLQGIKANARRQCAQAVVQGNAGNRWIFWVMSPLVGISNLLMLAATLFSRTVRWRGVKYIVFGPNRLRRIENRL